MDNASSHVLMVDDGTVTCNQLREYLGKYDFQVTSVPSGKQVLELIQRETIDLLLLETGVRGDDGLRLTRTVRESSSMPIVMLSGRDEVEDRVMGLESGADDYVTKPYSSRELLARIRAVLRRTRRAEHPVRDGTIRAYRFDGWELNLRLLRLKAPDGTDLDISRGECGLLRAFLSSPQRILTRDQLLELTRVNSTEVYDRSIDVQILRLRRKIEADARNPRFIKTERGAGYFFDASVTIVR